MKNLDASDIADKPHPKRFTNAMLNVVLAWPKLEIGLTYWISLAIKLRPSETGILLGSHGHEITHQQAQGALYTPQ